MLVSSYPALALELKSHLSVSNWNHKQRKTGVSHGLAGVCYSMVFKASVRFSSWPVLM